MNTFLLTVDTIFLILDLFSPNEFCDLQLGRPITDAVAAIAAQQRFG
jgi:hypothetical protein